MIRTYFFSDHIDKHDMAMEFVKLMIEDNRYQYEEASNIEMCILGSFLASNVGCYRTSYEDWIFEASDTCSGNITFLYKEGNNIIMEDLYQEETGHEASLTIPINEFLRILIEWKQFCATQPKEVIGQEGFINVWISFFALIALTMLFALLALRLFKKRLDCV